MSEIIRLAEEYEACEIVVGLPTSLSGRAGTQVQRVKRFVDALADQTSVPVVLRDERYTSVQAERLSEGGGEAAVQGQRPCGFRRRGSDTTVPSRLQANWVWLTRASGLTARGICLFEMAS